MPNIATVLSTIPIQVRPDEWVQRRFRLPPSTAQLVCELAFSNRIATLADHGVSYVSAATHEARQ